MTLLQRVQSSVEAKTGLPVISLYGNSFDSLKPKRKDFDDIDILICDLQDEGFESFVGMYKGLPVRHGMTIGELAKYFNTEHNIGCKLHVVTMEGWKREWNFDQTGLPWVKPSPNIHSQNNF